MGAMLIFYIVFGLWVIISIGGIVYLAKNLGKGPYR